VGQGANYDAESHALVNTLDFGVNANTDNMWYVPVATGLLVARTTKIRSALPARFDAGVRSRRCIIGMFPRGPTAAKTAAPALAINIL